MLAPGHGAALTATLSPSRELPAQDRISARQAETFLEVFEHIHMGSVHGLLSHDPLTFDPLAGRRPRVLATKLGKPRTRTPSLAPADYFKLVSCAARWVIEFSEHIAFALEQLYVQMSKQAAGPNQGQIRRALATGLEAAAPPGLPRLTLSWLARPDDPGGSMTVGQALKHLMTACFILAASFGARRVEETLSIRAGCVKEAKPGVLVMSILIEKAAHEREDIPTVPLADYAVTALTDLTQPTRDMSGEEWLFEVALSLDDAGRCHVCFRPEDGLSAFATLCGLDLEVSPHMLRRGAAIAFYHGCRFATVDAVSYWLRHLDPAVTRIYLHEILPGMMGRLREDIDARSRVATERLTTEEREWLRLQKRRLRAMENAAAVWDDVRCESIVNRLLETYAGADEPIGRGAATFRADLREMTEQAMAHVRSGPRLNVLPADDIKFLDVLRKYPESHSLEPIPGGVAHCTCKPGDEADLVDAECLRAKAAVAAPWVAVDGAIGAGDIRPDYAFAADYVCLGCRHCCSFAEDRATAGAELARLEGAVATTVTENARLDALGRYDRLSTTVGFHLSASVFACASGRVWRVAGDAVARWTSAGRHPALVAVRLRGPR